MCGISCYIGGEDAAPIVLRGLRNLEYRGYDSYGIAVKLSDKIEVKKSVGRISDSSLQLPKSNIAISHTRWATHGGVTEANAHPHLSCDEKLALVHNGIIENYTELKKELQAKGHKFRSETDTETAVHLIEEGVKGGKPLMEAVMEACRQIVGTFAFSVISVDEEKMVVARRGSPIAIGIGSKGDFFVGSDVTAFLHHTKKSVFLDDDQLAMIEKGEGIKYFDIKTGKEVEKKITEIEWDPAEAQKQGHKHFMLKEIMEQPIAIQKAIQGRIKDGLPCLEEIDSLEEFLKNTKRIVIVACGTALYAGWTSEYFLENALRLPVEIEYASEYRYRNPVVDDSVLTIAVSQSGETADTLAALRESKKRGSKVLAICNVMGSTIARESDAVIYNRAGPEIGVASTKAFTTQVSILLLVGLHIGLLQKKIDEAKVKEITSALQQLPEQVKEALAEKESIQEIAKKYYEKKNALFLGRGQNFPIALEGALKLKEISYLHAEGYAAAEMKHGPIALVDEETPSVFVVPKDRSYDKTLGNVEEIKARKGNVIAVSNKGASEIARIADDVIYIPTVREELIPIVAVVPLQLLAYYIADLRNCDIDKPRNLAKSVTVE